MKKSKDRPLKLEQLPVVAHALNRLRVAQTIDELVKPDPRRTVSIGRCVEALVTSILTGTHTLYRVEQKLAGYDLDAGLAWSESAGLFHDQRLARALDAVVRTGVNKVASALFVRAVSEYKLDLSTMRVDTTNAQVFGEYATSREPEDPEDPDAIPHLARGYSKDGRRSLKQVVFGLAVSGEGVPLLGRAASGNRADASELRHLMRRVAERVPDPTEVTVVGDSKLFCGQTLLLAEELRFDYVTLIPRNFSLRGEAIKRLREIQRSSPGKIEIFHQKYSAKRAVVDQWRGTSMSLVYDYADEHKRVTKIPLRVVVVESSVLRRDNERALEALRAKELERLEVQSKRCLVTAHVTEADAKKAVMRLEAKEPRFHTIEAFLREEVRDVKRTKLGRPRKGDVRERETIWRAGFNVKRNDASFNEALEDGSCFVLATNHADTGEHGKTDAEIFTLYHQQGQVETAFHWMKGELNFAPIFLKRPHRIAALAAVYVIALMVHALIARDAGVRLEAAAQKIPGNLKPTAKPSTEVIFRLFEHVSATRSPTRDHAELTTRVLVGNMTTEQCRAYKVLGAPLENRAGFVLAEVRAPGPGDRGYYPHRANLPENSPKARRDP